MARHTVDLTWLDRKGESLQDSLYVYAVRFIPLYGPCLVTDLGEISVERVVTAEPVPIRKVA